MGSDINGWVEVRQTDGSGWDIGWSGAIYLRTVVERNYPMFGILFDHRTHWNFPPLAPRRGLPDDKSDEVSYQIVERLETTLYASWVLWSELEQVNWDEEIEDEGEIRTRKNAISPGWATLFSMMATLAEQYGSEKVRMVTWFDSE